MVIVDMFLISRIQKLSGNVLISSDRDEKIRLTNYQHPFIIENFALGHTM
jgi:hypothetical protein